MKISSKVLAFVLACMGVMNAAAMDKFPRIELTKEQLAQRMSDLKSIPVSEKMIVYVQAEHLDKVESWVRKAKAKAINPSDGAILIHLSEKILQKASDGINIQFDVKLMDDGILKEFCSLQNKAAVTDPDFNFGALGVLCNASCQASLGDAWIAFTAGMYCSKYADGDSAYQGMFAFSPNKAQGIANSFGIQADSCNIQ
ncbi:hypothetical protein FACS1894122_06420 [Alphaproteobacteria bacterium]|nr:hypothetical protein FACS1894122_06420 [Alphaproteobacteria bacterium]